MLYTEPWKVPGILLTLHECSCLWAPVIITLIVVVGVIVAMILVVIVVIIMPITIIRPIPDFAFYLRTLRHHHIHMPQGAELPKTEFENMCFWTLWYSLQVTPISWQMSRVCGFVDGGEWFIPSEDEQGREGRLPGPTKIEITAATEGWVIGRKWSNSPFTSRVNVRTSFLRMTSVLQWPV